MATGPSISIKALNLNLGNTQILEQVSFNIEAGSVHCIVGANGGGKTSLVRCILGQMPHSGTIDIHWQANHTIGYVPQFLDFDRTLPVRVIDFMAMVTQRRPAFLGQSRGRRQQVETLLERFGLTDKRKYKLGNLSGGERQRLLIAQALIPEPSLLVLDEPATALDVTGGNLLLQAVKDFVAGGGTVIWINHDIVQVQRLADRLTYINRTIKLDGIPEEVLRSDVAQRIFPSLDIESGAKMEARV